MKHKHISKLTLAATFCFFLSCSNIERDNPYDPEGVSYIGDKFSYGAVTYEGYIYPTIVIGTQTWMVKNLNYNASGSKCYDNKKSNCAIYGRLYDWATAMALPDSCNSSSCSVGTNHQGICPEGLHIPSYDEWITLINVIGSSSLAGRYLKALTGWNSGGNGEDKYGFAALPGGHGGFGGFVNVGNIGHWLSATGDTRSTFQCLNMWSNDAVDKAFFDKRSLFSVRCVQD